MKKITQKVLVILLAALLPMLSYAQVTTSAISGRVSGSQNEYLPGATIVAIHVPSGTKYVGASNQEGLFTIGNMRIGGPYKITATYVGYSTKEINDIYLSLGNVSDVKISLAEATTQLNEVVVTSYKSDLINSQRTGAATNISSDEMTAIPTISRGLKDFTKMSPLANTAGSGTSFAGNNNRYNQFSIDGLVNNDVFGLAASGTNGGQANIEPVSIDAIDEIQINIAPYDVRQGGFTGGGINAVTKSGSNTFHGSGYYYGNNQNLVGDNNPNTNVKKAYPDYTDYKAGLTLGGPIVKDKLFFFVSGEYTDNKTPLAYKPGSDDSKITLDEVNRVLATLTRIAPGYNPGKYEDISKTTISKKVLAKVDWNISDQHKLTLRHSYTYGEYYENSRTSTAMRFYNNGFVFPTTTNSTGLELNSTFGANTSNKFALGYTRVRDDRNPMGDAFPTVFINIGNSRTITLGNENSSVANQLDQDIYSIDDDFTIYKGKHTITVGTHNELYKFYNLFVQNIYGYYGYNSLANFESVGTTSEVAPTYYAKGYSFDASDDPSQSNGAAEFKAMQLGFYAQDKFQIMPNLQVTGGLRIDIPMFLDKPGANEAFNTSYAAYGVATGDMPKSKIMLAPRVGFNWDVFGDKTLQVRGGSGLFTGRVPFVWVSNQFSNNGQLNGAYSTGSTASSATPLTSPTKFNADPYSQPSAEDLGKTAGRGAINVIDKDFKFPQVFRTNLAIDKTLPWNVVATVEGIFSHNYNDVNYQNLNRQEDPSFTFKGVDNRPRYKSGRIDSKYDEILMLTNDNQGYTYNMVFQLQKEFKKGFIANAAYTYGHSKDLNSGTSSVAYSNWRYVNNTNGLNKLPLTYANFDLGSRIMAFVTYKKEYLNGLLSSQVSLFYNGQSGLPLSYIYNGDMNNDGTTNDMIYVPNTISDINLVSYSVTNTDGTITTVTPDEQWTKLDNYIKGDDYLKNRRGKYAERNGARLPFQHQFDFRFVQEVKIKTDKVAHSLQFSLDIINVGNLLNNKWGRQYTASNQQFALVNYLGQSKTDATAPTYTYTGSSLTNGKPYSASDLESRWRMQFGLRYSF